VGAAIDRPPTADRDDESRECVFILFRNSPDDPVTTHLDSTLARLEN
jgi:hypothetical protein